MRSATARGAPPLYGLAVDGCRICALQADVDALPARERIHVGRHWRLAHGWSSLEGWLVACSLLHHESLDELGGDALASLGPLVAAAGSALKRAVGCERTYLALFAERPGFRHLHVHVVPRMPWFGPGEAGPGAFRFLNPPEHELLPAARRDELAAQLAPLIAERLTP